MSMSDIIAMRSDLVPGQYTCIECNRQMQLQEAWRKEASQDTCSLAALFCSECGQKLRRIGLDVSPLSLTILDKLNLQT